MRQSFKHRAIRLVGLTSATVSMLFYTNCSGSDKLVSSQNPESRSLNKAMLSSVSETSTPLGVPPAIAGHKSDRLVIAGYLDVSLYGAKGDGVTDDTNAIQNAMNDGVAYNMAAYLDGGKTYLISRQLIGLQPFAVNNYSIGTIERYGMEEAPTLVGPANSTPANRPTIVLKNGASGFGSAGSPQSLLLMVDLPGNYLSVPPTSASCGSQYARNLIEGCYDVLFAGVVRDVNFTTGANPGAIGVQFYGAQYSYMQNVSVNATGGYGGIEGAPSTDAWVNLSVTGGQYGILMDKPESGVNTVAGLTLQGQTTAGVYINGTQAGDVFAGFDIQENNVPAFVLSETNIGNNESRVSLLDGRMAITGPAGSTVPAISNVGGLSLYLNNVYASAPSALVTNNGRVAIAGNGNTSLIPEYAHAETIPLTLNGVPRITEIFVNDTQEGTDYLSTPVVQNTTASSDLVIRHLPGQMPWIMDSGALWVTDYGADPTGYSDSTAAIQSTINAAEASGVNEVFLPRGVYSLSATLKLGPNTKFFGVPGQFTELAAYGWVTNGVMQSYIQVGDTSVASKTGHAMVGDILFMLPNDDSLVVTQCASSPTPCKIFPSGFNPGKTENGFLDNTYLSAITWMTGQSSVLNEIQIQMQYQNSTDTSTAPRNFITISNYGGGRWYGMEASMNANTERTENPSFRFILTEGTSQPLTLYGSNPEHSHETSYEFSNSSNIRILGLKAETSTTIALIDNSSNNIMIVGMDGNFGPSVGHPTCLVQSGTNVTVANIGNYGPASNGTSIGFVSEPNRKLYSANDVYAIVKMGSFNANAFPHCGDGICDGGETSLTCPSDCGSSRQPASTPTPTPAPTAPPTSTPTPPPTGTFTPSASGTTIPSATKITDGSGNVWTVSGGVVYENGATAGFSSGVTELLYYNGMIYQLGAGNWFSWYASGKYWSATTNPNPNPTATPAPTPSANGTTIPSASQIVDSSGNVWTVSGGVVYENGATAGFSSGVTELLYYNGMIYQLGAGNWFSWYASGKYWSATTNPNPTPTPTPTPTPPANTITINAGQTSVTFSSLGFSLGQNLSGATVQFYLNAQVSPYSLITAYTVSSKTSFTSGQHVNFSNVTFTLPSSLASGTYVITAGIYTATVSTQTNKLGTVIVQ